VGKGYRPATIRIAGKPIMGLDEYDPALFKQLSIKPTATAK
jgi:hypothetical protein